LIRSSQGEVTLVGSADLIVDPPNFKGTITITFDGDSIVPLEGK
jgi:hypothetical protein